MNIAPTLQDYLAERQIAYEVLPHTRTVTSATTAQAAHLPGRSVAKAVVVEDERGYVLAVVPATAHVQLPRLERELHRSGLHLASEPELGKLFPDCELGAVPALGQAYGLPTIVEEELAAQPDVFFEAGDHRHLVHVSQGEFSRLIAEARCARFCD
ncbi:MAG: YbaK/EbsC family protein [Betaproteobacteria bacterium]|nr:MAG: YbaK/EbsC family protein [Betaproteobacteria bacterium]